MGFSPPERQIEPRRIKPAKNPFKTHYRMGGHIVRAEYAVTEIPQHLLDRSKKRRGGGASDSGDGGAAAPAAEAGDGGGAAVATVPAEPVIDDRLPADLELKPINGDAQTLEEWLLLFHLVVVVLDPYTDESAWILPTAGRVLSNFDGAGARVAWVLAADEADTKQFLGPYADKILAFADPELKIIDALELKSLPALVHIKQDRNVAGSAEGWQPQEWNEITTGLAKMLRWTRPLIPAMDDPPPFAGSPSHPSS